ncbi:hypothetical protein B296_00023681 [Ensete ventricosum]|uniref:Uncharacterized protein n=1 Tax=Ensete ventricosum TaxID=4639 RepID=A0A426XYV7_ENSVE|nr:hypothetical protein B296_00023681 [Ensete ventricosum]
MGLGVVLLVDDVVEEDEVDDDMAVDVDTEAVRPPEDLGGPGDVNGGIEGHLTAGGVGEEVSGCGGRARGRRGGPGGGGAGRTWRSDAASSRWLLGAARVAVKNGSKRDAVVVAWRFLSKLSDEGGCSRCGCGRGGRGRQQRGEEDARMGAAAIEEGATAVDVGVAAAVWLKHGCAPVGWACRRQMGAAATTYKGTDALRQQEAEAALLCTDGEEEGEGGSNKAEEAAGKRRQRGRVAGSGDAAWEMAGMAGGDEEEGRNCGGRRRKKQPRERATVKRWWMREVRKTAVEEVAVVVALVDGRSRGDGAAADAALADGRSRGDGATADAALAGGRRRGDGAVADAALAGDRSRGGRRGKA